MENNEITTESNEFVPKDKDIRIALVPWKVVLIAAVAIISGVLSFFCGGSNIIYAIEVFLISGLLTYVSLVDLELHLAPDWASLFILGIGIINVVLRIFAKDWSDLIQMGVGLLICFIPLAIAAVASRGGIGGADVKIMSALGLFLGARKAFFALIIGLAVAILFNLIVMFVKKTDKKQRFALLPYLSIGSTIMFFL